MSLRGSNSSVKEALENVYTLSPNVRRGLLTPDAQIAIIVSISVVVGLVLLSVIGYCIYKECVLDRSESRKQKRRLMEHENRMEGDVTWDDIDRETDPKKKRMMKEQLIVQKSRKKLKFDEENKKVLKNARQVEEMQFWQDAHAEAVRTCDLSDG